MKIKTTKGIWTVHGTTFIPSDAIYTHIKNAIEHGPLTEEHLQKVTGHLAPITIDVEHQTITFQRF